MITIGNHNLKFNNLGDLKDVIPQLLNTPFESKSLKAYINNIILSDVDIWFEPKWVLRFEENNFNSLEDQVKLDKEISFKGPFDLTINFGVHCFWIYSLLRWNDFLLNDEIQRDFRSIVKLITFKVRGNEAIYIPDGGAHSSYYEQYVATGENLAKIKTLMKINVGNPANNIKDILESKSDISINDGYFIDNFGNVSD